VRFRYWLLKVAEVWFLRLSGWKSVGEDGWRPPEGYPFRVKHYYSRGHAVNAQKLADEQEKRWNRNASSC
jgi:hypothetical protein